MGPDNRHYQARLPPLRCGVLHPRLGGRPHLERDQAALGRGAQGKFCLTLSTSTFKLKLFSGVRQ